MRSSILLAGSMLAALATSAFPQGPAAKFNDLLRRVPDQANAMVLVDVDALFNSPLGLGEKWREKSAERPTNVLGVSTDASRFVVAAGIDLSTAEERWKVGMLSTLASPPSLSTLAAREGGYVEQLETQNVAWTPRNFYLLSFPERIVGFAAPSDRQALAGWLKSSFIKPRLTSPRWADRAIFRANQGSPIVLAVNLDKAIAPRSAEAWLKDFHGESVKKNAIAFDILAARLAGAKSAHLQIDVKESIEGQIRIDFDSSVEIVKPIAKELVLSALSDYGAAVEELSRWTPSVKDKTITLSGRMSEPAVRQFLSMVAVPRLASGPEPSAASPSLASTTPKAAQPPEVPAGEPTPEVVRKATQQYFRSVTDIARSLKTQKSTTQQSLKFWYDRAARQIEELPILHVDNEALDWGSVVARTLREMAYGITYTAKDATHRIAGTANGSYGGYGYGYGNGGSRAVSAGVITKQNNAVLDVSLTGRWETLETSISEMRRKLVAKYKVDF